MSETTIPDELIPFVRSIHTERFAFHQRHDDPGAYVAIDLKTGHVESMTFTLEEVVGAIQEEYDAWQESHYARLHGEDGGATF